MQRMSDWVIIAFLLVCGTFVAWVILKKLSRYLLIPVILAVIVLAYSCIVEPLAVVVNQVDLHLNGCNISKPVKLAIISDLHLGKFLNTQATKNAIKRISEEQNLDALLILGDSMNDTPKSLSQVDVLTSISKRIPPYYILGNHDLLGGQGSKVIPGLEDAFNEVGITVLRNRVETVSSLSIAGIDDIWSGTQKFDVLDNYTSKDCVLLLSHNPDVVLENEFQARKSKIDLVLSGHTHAGEMRLPIIGPISRLPTELPRQYDKGLFNYQGNQLLITSGIGNVGIRARLFNNPEIVILTIR